jgi:N-acetylglucosamine kinase-like BadF-type ATPase
MKIDRQKDHLKNNKTILVADAGGTSTQWALYDPSRDRIDKILTQGINPYADTFELIKKTLSDSSLTTLLKEADIIQYFGAGLQSTKHQDLIKVLLQALSTKSTKIECYPDTELCIRAHGDHYPFTSVILGTGCSAVHVTSNGQRKVFQPSLGYLLGDEGSGAYYGKKLLKNWLTGKFDAEINSQLEETYSMNQMNALSILYSQDNPQRFLGNFFPFVYSYKGHPLMAKIIEEGIQDLVTFVLAKYPTEFPVHFSGSVAFLLKDLIKNILPKYNLTVGSIIKEPLNHYLASLKIGEKY